MHLRYLGTLKPIKKKNLPTNYIILLPNIFKGIGTGTGQKNEVNLNISARSFLPDLNLKQIIFVPGKIILIRIYNTGFLPTFLNI